MSSPDWRGAVKHLKARLATADPEQRALAEKLGMELGARTPRLAAAALLRDKLAAELDRPVRPVSEAQREFLEDLDYWNRRGDPKPSTYSVAYALIEILDARRSLDYLRLEKPRAGDLVFLPLRSDRRKPHGSIEIDRLRMVSSIGDDGTVYFAGGGGAQAPIRAVEVLHRADDQGAEALKARDAVSKRASRQADGLQGVRSISAVKARLLRPFKVEQRMIVARDIDALRGVIEAALDEQPIQLFLQERPYLLTALLGGGHGRWLRSQVSFGGIYYGDFAIADADSTGIRWRLVELESPCVAVFGAKGQFLKEARKAQDQIATWRHYIAQNPDQARKPREDGGLGLVGIDAGAPGLILISRRATVARDEHWRRRELEAEHVQMHTYDWLIEQLEGQANMRSEPYD
jgi:hypothetical protein